MMKTQLNQLSGFTLRLDYSRQRFSPLVASIALATAFLIALLVLTPSSNAATKIPKWTPDEGTIAPGVTVGGVDVGSKTLVDAEAAVNLAWSEPAITIQVGKRTYLKTRASLGQVLRTKNALAQAWGVGRLPEGAPVSPPVAPATLDFPIKVTVERDPINAWLADVEKRTYIAYRDASYVLKGRRPKVIRHVTGQALRTEVLRNWLVDEMTTLPTKTKTTSLQPSVIEKLPPKITVKELGVVLVVDRSERRLRIWSPRKLIKKVPIAVGVSEYPTPLGNYTVAEMQKNPTWFPPDSEWAEDAEPIPPGADNPLGTRWIGMDHGGIGFHGTPNTASVGTAASHGCMRMYKSDVEWLYKKVTIGTPVHIRA